MVSVFRILAITRSFKIFLTFLYDAANTINSFNGQRIWCLSNWYRKWCVILMIVLLKQSEEAIFLCVFQTLFIYNCYWISGSKLNSTKIQILYSSKSNEFSSRLSMFKFIYIKYVCFYFPPRFFFSSSINENSFTMTLANTLPCGNNPDNAWHTFRISARDYKKIRDDLLELFHYVESFTGDINNWPDR